MSEPKHSPLPWRIDPDDRPDMEWNNHIVSAPNPNLTICFMSHDGTKENEIGEANAALIVRAVNCHEELLAALKENLEQAIGCWINHYGDNPEGSPMPHHIESAAAAINKAENKTPSSRRSGD